MTQQNFSTILVSFIFVHGNGILYVDQDMDTDVDTDTPALLCYTC